MAILSIELERVCSGGEHVELRVTLGQNDLGLFKTAVTELMSNISQDEREAILKGILRIHAIGKTKAQMRSNLTRTPEGVLETTWAI